MCNTMIGLLLVCLIGKTVWEVLVMNFDMLFDVMIGKYLSKWMMASALIKKGAEQNI